MRFQKKLFIKHAFVLFFFTSVILIWRCRQVVQPPIIFSEPRISIMFVETKVGKPNLSLREICSIESAAFHHPDAEIILYNVNGKSNDERDENLKMLVAHYPMIYFRSLNSSEIFIGTPLEKWSEENRISESAFPTEHMSDAIRLALLWKLGGLYLDTDAIVIKPFYEFKNAIGLTFKFVVGNGVMTFQKNSSFIYNIMHYYAANYNGQIYVINGPILISIMLIEICQAIWLNAVANNPDVCQGIRLLPVDIFYPIANFEWYKLFEKRTNDSVDLSQSYAVHLYSSLTKKHLVKTGEGTFIETLFQANCPHTYQLILKNKYL